MESCDQEAQVIHGHQRGHGSRIIEVINHQCHSSWKDVYYFSLYSEFYVHTEAVVRYRVI
jgi:hypothetical protein